MTTVAYNDIDDDCCDWLENLISDHQIPAGPVWHCGIETLEPSEIDQHDQIHFFAGIGGWALAAEWSGWQGPIWTASCPCQPFSGPGRTRKDPNDRPEDDPRHLWPAVRDLVNKCRPPVVVGEQVAGKLGQQWLASVRLDLEDLGYAFGAACLPAASVGAPHVRERFFWGAARLGLADTTSGRRREHREPDTVQYPVREEESAAVGPQGGAVPVWRDDHRKRSTYSPDQRHSRGRHQRERLEMGVRQRDAREPPAAEPPWSDIEFVPFADGFSRPVPTRDHQPRVLPLVDGLPEGVATERSSWGALAKKYVKRPIHGYGNAIVPQLGAVFLKSLKAALSELPA